MPLNDLSQQAVQWQVGVRPQLEQDPLSAAELFIRRPAGMRSSDLAFD